MNRNEAARYLGMKPSDLDERTEKLIEQCALKLENAVAPKHTYAVFDIKTEENKVVFNDFSIESKALAKHLKDCSEAVLFAATLGTEADRLISRAVYSDMSEAAVMQACAAVMIEEYCDSVMDEIKDEEKNRFLRPRFSPGYGDFSTSYQRDILNILNADRRIGVFVTDSDMLTPTKSVTAVIGITNEKGGCTTNKCAQCDNLFCVFRKE